LNVDVFRTSTVGDNTQRIAEIIRETLERTQVIHHHRRLGPTWTTPRATPVALAFGVETEFPPPNCGSRSSSAWGALGARPARTRNAQAYVPKGAIAVRNPVGTAPAFIVERDDKCLIALPGVPREMEYLAENEVFPYLRKRYKLTGTIKARVLHTAGMGESLIDEQVGEFEAAGESYGRAGRPLRRGGRAHHRQSR